MWFNINQLNKVVKDKHLSIVIFGNMNRSMSNKKVINGYITTSDFKTRVTQTKYLDLNECIEHYEKTLNNDTQYHHTRNLVSWNFRLNALKKLQELIVSGEAVDEVFQRENVQKKDINFNKDREIRVKIRNKRREKFIKKWSEEWN